MINMPVTKTLILFHYLCPLSGVMLTQPWLLFAVCCIQVSQFRANPQGNLSVSFIRLATCIMCQSGVVTGCNRKAGRQTQTIYYEALSGGLELVYSTIPVGEDLAVIVHLDLQHFVSIQLAGNGPSKCLKKRNKHGQVAANVCMQH